jgi:formate--tetrahydrofolate ligase
LRVFFFKQKTAYEIMAVLALATDFDDLRYRLERVTVATGQNREPVTAGDVGAVGSLMALLRHALLPNLVQTTEGQPAFVHTGPFGNIAHGCSSVVADRMALGYADFVLTEAGFGADLGFEKFMDIKCRGSGLVPSAAVIVATVRALRYHGGVARDRLAEPDLNAVEAGTANLAHVIGIVRGFGLPAVMAINRFASDTDPEIAAARTAALAAGASAAVESTGFVDGGEGSADLAAAVAEVAAGSPPQVAYPYRLTDPIADKVEALATKIYGAGGVHWSPRASRRRRRFENQGLSDLPICMAKTPMSLSHDPRRRNRPSGYTFEIVDCRASTGAGFIYPIASSILTMPGLPKSPRTLDVDAQGNILGF